MPFGRFRDKSIPLDNLGNYDSSGENIIHICSLASIHDAMLLFVTKTGMLKLVKGSEFDVSKRTVAATKLADGDNIITICIADNFNQLVLQTENGYFIRFPMMNIPEMKKTAIASAASASVPVTASKLLIHWTAARNAPLSTMKRNYC